MRISSFLAFLLLALSLSSQEIPAGVRYNRATDAVNKTAFDRITKLLASKPDSDDLSALKEVVICGPGLWNALKGLAPAEMQKAMPITFVIPGSGVPQSFEGKGFKTPSQQRAFLRLVLKIFGSQPKTVVRKAKADELSYYWAIIPYDITEPVYVAVVGKHRLIFDFDDSNDPHIFTIDVVGEIRK